MCGRLKFSLGFSMVSMVGMCCEACSRDELNLECIVSVCCVVMGRVQVDGDGVRRERGS